MLQTLKGFVLDRIHEAAFLVDTTGRILYVNYKACQQLEYTEKQLLNLNLKNIDQHWPTEFNESDWLALWYQMRKEGGITFETEHKTRSGRILPVEVTAYYFEYTECTHILGLVRDISERKQTQIELQRYREHLEVANQELRNSELEYRSLVENLPDIVVRYNAQCQITYCNPKGMQLLSCFSQQVVGKTPCEILNIESIQELQRTLQRVIQTTQPAQIEIEAPGFDNSIRTYQIRFIHEQTPNGDIQGALAICRDVTEQVLTVQKLAESHLRQRELLARREADLENERRRIAREMHDELGQLLTALKLGISTLEMQLTLHNSLLKTKTAHLLNLADQAIQSVRTVSTSLRPSALDMGITSALQWLISEFQLQNGVTCQVNLPEDLNDINELQAMTLYRTLQEALTNITRHAEARRVQIKLYTEPDGTLILGIQDDGRGFDPGTDLSGHFGLIGMHERIHSLGGKLKIISAPGSGTCICMTIPPDQVYHKAYDR